MTVPEAPPEIVIAGRRVATDAPCLVIGEVAQGHDGSLGIALSFIDAIADAGADAVKFQTHIAAAESTPGEPWRVRFSEQDDSRYDYWTRTAFDEREWQVLADRAAERGLLFLSSPFSPEAVDLLRRVGVSAWKVASGQVLDARCSICPCWSASPRRACPRSFPPA
jgi:N,N'-diacetyllegionaminate synthase